MADRAIRLGGRFEVRRGADAGTVLEWTVPRSPATVDEPRPE
jgi:hypothetical protein